MECILIECKRSFYCKGYCQLHYTRIWRNGYLNKKYPKFCSIETCTRKYHCKGFCIKHHYLMNKEKYNQQGKDNYLKNRDKVLVRTNKYKRENGRSVRNGSIELQIAMNNVRKRDNNTCQWQNCGLKHSEAPIHVNHIFPRSEYPELELIEEYMICYCANHHGIWHRYRGDKYYAFIGDHRLK